MLLLFKEGKTVPLIKTIFISLTNKLQRQSPGVWEPVYWRYRTTDVFSTGWLAGNVLVLAPRSKTWEAMSTMEYPLQS